MVVNTDRLSPDERRRSLPVEALAESPLTQWATTQAPKKPIDFFQPNSNAGELLQTAYQRVPDLADEISAIPKYLSGGSSGGAWTKPPAA